MQGVEREKPAGAELRERYRDDYVANYHQHAGHRLERPVGLMDLSLTMTVADLACGNGLLLDLIHDRVGGYHGVDFSEEFIEDARRRHAGHDGCEVHFSCQSISEFCATHRQSIDRAFCFDFVEHLYDEDLLPILRAIHGCLAREGRFYLHTPNAEFLLEILKDRGVLKQFLEHIAVRSAEQNVVILEAA
jgi:2-polyprenyl-6-hydroxyphenyl methylase/3-demethylubiquinone-9 3-methyltransferase